MSAVKLGGLPPLTRKTARKRGLAPDSHGRYRPYVGFYVAADGQRRPKRFNLGTDRPEAERRYHRLHDLFADLNGDVWKGRTLAYAEQIAAGERPSFTAFATDSYFPYVLDTRKPEDYAQAIEQERRIFPSLAGELQADNPALLVESVEAQRDRIQARLRALQNELDQLGALQAANVTLPAKLIPGTFHEALDSYVEEFKRHTPRLPGGELKPSTEKRIAKVERLKANNADCPLHELTKDRIADYAAYWRNRPKTKRDKSCSRPHAKHHLGEFFRFLEWLDGSDKYQWATPKGLASISRKIARFDHEKKLAAVTKHTYEPHELAQLNATATDRERLALYLALNCAMGAAELGRLVIDDFCVDQPHPFAKKLGIHSTAADCFLRYFRPKTGVFGEWYLWPETVELVRRAIERSKAIGSDLIFCRETGTPLYDERLKKPDAGFANLWGYCRKRSKITKKLPFGSLRDTLPDHFRGTCDNPEIASICLTHGTPGVDKLIDCYANKPFGQLHEAIKKSRAYYAPVFDAIRD